MLKKKLKIAIVYDWIDTWGGVERVLIYLHSLFPDALFFTSTLSYKNAKWAKGLSIKTSFLQKLPPQIRAFRWLLAPFFPYAFESFTFDDFDLVISLTSAFAKGIITKPGTTHVCYLLTPPRYLWSHTDDYLTGVKKILSYPIFNHLKKWDKIAALRPDFTISISQVVADRASDYYTISSPVVYPPFDSEYWDGVMKRQIQPVGIDVSKPYYLWVGRMESYKRADLIIEAASRMPHSSFIFVGRGRMEEALKRKSSHNCQFTGLIPDEQLSHLYSHATALIMPQNEDFGYVSLESQYHGCPVIAYQAGGACETIISEQTGLFFTEQTVSSLMNQLERCDKISYNLSLSTHMAQKRLRDRFGVARFRREFVNQLEKYIPL